MKLTKSNSHFRNPLQLLLGMLLILLTACASTPQPLQIRSDVDALATADAQNKRRFVILPANKDVSEQDLQFIEFKSYVQKALTNRGFSKANTLEEGDLLLYLSYGVGEPHMQQYAYEVPIWSDFGYYPYYRPYRYYPRMSTYGMTGYAQRIETYTLYRRFLSLDAYDMAAYLHKKTPQQLWKINVQSQGQSDDLRLIFPFMVAAMQPFMGTNTGHMVTVDIDEFNPVLHDLKSGNSSQELSPALQYRLN